MRAFIGIKPDGCLADLIAIQNDLKQQTKANFTKPDNLHITLFFLGEIDEGQTQKIKRLFQNFSFPRFSLEINAITNFREMIIATLSPSLALKQLHKKLGDCLMRDGFLLENRPYFAHLTLARKTDYVVNEAVLLTTTVENIVLFASERQETGLVYRRIVDVKLN